MAKSLSELVAEIVLAQSERRDLDADEITRLSLQTAQAFKTIQQMEKGINIPTESLFPAAEPAQHPVATPEEQADKSCVQEEPLKPKKNPLDSIKKDEIICLECGQAFKQISFKHLKMHGLTPEEYRTKHGFSKRQPLTARSVSEKRGERVKESGLAAKMQEGRRKKTESGSAA